MSEQTALTPQQSFEQKMKDRIRKDIGELMPDEVLAMMVQKVMQESFFDARLKRDSWGHVQSEEPAPIAEMIIDLTRDMVTDAATRWIESHTDDVMRVVRETIENGFVECVARSVRRMIDGPFYSFAEQVEQRFQKLGSA